MFSNAWLQACGLPLKWRGCKTRHVRVTNLGRNARSTGPPRDRTPGSKASGYYARCVGSPNTGMYGVCMHACMQVGAKMLYTPACSSARRARSAPQAAASSPAPMHARRQRHVELITHAPTFNGGIDGLAFLLSMQECNPRSHACMLPFTYTYIYAQRAIHTVSCLPACLRAGPAPYRPPHAA